MPIEERPAGPDVQECPSCGSPRILSVTVETGKGVVRVRALRPSVGALLPYRLGGHGDALKPGSPRRLPAVTTTAKLRRAPSIFPEDSLGVIEEFGQADARHKAE